MPNRTEPLIRVVIIEDHRLVAEALEAALAQVPDMRVEAVTGSLADGVVAVDETQPDVVMLDVRLPDGDGASGTAHVLASCPTACVLIVSAHGSVEVVARSVEAGAVGFVPKTGNVAELVDAVRRCAQGAIVIPPQLLREVADYLRTRPTPVGSDLTPREREVLARLSRGASPASIAEELHISTHTVRNHVRALRRKLGARSQLEAVAIAYRAGVLDAEPD